MAHRTLTAGNQESQRTGAVFISLLSWASAFTPRGRQEDSAGTKDEGKRLMENKGGVDGFKRQDGRTKTVRHLALKPPRRAQDTSEEEVGGGSGGTRYTGGSSISEEGDRKWGKGGGKLV